MRESDDSLNGPKRNMDSAELNDNECNNARMFGSNESLISGISHVTVVSGDSSYSRRSSEEFDSRGDIYDIPEYSRDGRSNSCSGVSEDLNDFEAIDIFPSLPEYVLAEMGLTNDQARKLQTEDELERKFATLSLAFSIDSNTIRDRCERQQRYRNQTEDNLANEIEKLIQRVNKLTKVCVDMETTEMLASLLAQIYVVTNASALAASSAERYGAVQHEQRLSEAVQLMINHVNSLKQQRDLSRKQLRYTKKMLQTSGSKENLPSRKKNGTQHPNDPTKRRASIALATLLDGRKSDKHFMRRTSELAFRTSAIPKTSRASRLDLSVDLNNIKEGMVDENSNHPPDSPGDKNSTSYDDSEETVTKEQTLQRIETETIFTTIQRKIETIYKHWSDEGHLSHMFYISAIFCFCFAMIIMSDMFFELKDSKR